MHEVFAVYLILLHDIALYNTVICVLLLEVDLGLVILKVTGKSIKYGHPWTKVWEKVMEESGVRIANVWSAHCHE